MDHRKAFEQAERLSAIVYLNSLVIHKDSPTLGSAIEKMRETEKDWPCRMDRLDWLKVMDGIQGDEALKALRIIKVEDIEATQPGLVRNGHRAVLLGDNSGRGYVIFRGTGSDEEWDDNAKGMLEAETLQQQAAARFVQQICGQFKHITVAGHSKGGNKAQYATITLPETCIDCCFSFDGQGFSMAFWGKYRDAIEKRKPIIHLASERRGFVHALGFPVKETRYHIGRRGDPQKNLPHGYPLSYFHSPDALRDAAGDIGPESADNLIPATLNKLVTHFLETPKYSPHWEKTASGLTSLMSQTKRAEESASAIAQLLMVFVDLIASDVSFRRQVTEMVLKETDVLLASMDAARAAYSPVWPGALHDMGKKTAHHLAHLLAADRKARRRFIETVRFIIALRHLLITGKQLKLSGYIGEWMHITLKILSMTLGTLTPVLGKIQKALHDRKKQQPILELLDDWEALEKSVIT